MNKEERCELAEILFPNITKTREYYEELYPERDLDEGAMVTRYGPSPTGSVHLGNLYSAFCDMVYARQSKGVFFLRIEDTDQKRMVEGGIENIVSVLHGFDILPTEGYSFGGKYGSYQQSERAEIYQTYVKDLIKQGLAYPCFMTEEELNNSNLSGGSLNIQKSKFINLNLYISGDLTQTFEYNDDYSGGLKETNIDSIGLDINNFLYTMQTLSANRQEEINNSLSLQEYTVAHDLKELPGSISASVIESFDSFVKQLRSEKSLNHSDGVQFYSVYTNNLGQVQGYKQRSSGADEKHHANHGYYLPPTSEFQLPLIQDNSL